VKTIGVLGGVGPQATMDFEARVHRTAQRLIPPAGNRGYPPMIVYYFRHAPFREAEDGSPAAPLRPHPDLVEAAAKLGRLADFIVITSNFLHLFRATVEQAAGCEVISMIDATLAEVRRRQWQQVGVLGFGDPIVYTNPLAEMGLSSETIEGERRDRLDRAILNVMEGRDDAESVSAAEEAVAALRAKQVDGIILGCTEIPLLLGDSAASDLINPIERLAEAAVQQALA